MKLTIKDIAYLVSHCKEESFVNDMSPCSQCVLKWLNSEVEE